MSCYHLYTAILGTPEWQIHRPIHVMFYLILGFLLYKGTKRDNKVKFGMDIVFAILSLAIFFYIMMDFERFSTRIPMLDPITLFDIFLGSALILLILEMTRRTTGWALVFVALFFMSSCIFGQYFPGILNSTGVSYTTFIDYMFFTSDGIYGSPVSVSASYVFLFVLFGVFLESTGVGDYFIQMATSVTRRLRGGSAKASVLASGLFGSISGSAVANVYATGTFTIPLMKKSGFNPHFAGAVEAVASSGGAVMPPVMGSAAFLMADFIGKPYGDIALASLIPAILYYISLWFVVDIEAKKLGQKNESGAIESINIMYFIKHIYMFLPIICIIVLLLMGFTAFYAAFYAIISTLVVGLINDRDSVKPKKILDALEKGGKTAITIAAPLTCASLVVGSISLTGVGLKMTTLILKYSEGSLPIGLFLTMLITIILGMGLPTAAAYLIVAIFAPSALMKFGVPILTAHLFCFYYSAFSTITPPVAMAAYAGGVIAGAPINKTAFTAMKIGIAAFIIPWVFVYSPALLMEGLIMDILIAVCTGVIGVYALACGTQGIFFDYEVNVFFRLLLIIAAVALIKPGGITDFVGVVLLLLTYLYHKYVKKCRNDENSEKIL